MKEESTTSFKPLSSPRLSKDFGDIEIQAGYAQGFFCDENKALKLHESMVRPRAKKAKFTNRKIDQFFKNQNIHDYEPDIKKSYFDDIETSGFSVMIADGGHLVEIKRQLGSKPDELGKKKGDLIDGYSRGSRNRFIKKLLSIDYKKMGTPLFYTLTYPGEYSDDPKAWKRDLDAFFLRLRRRYHGLCSTWRLEPQKRGAPHFCGFLWGCDDLKTKDGKVWFSSAWYEVVRSGDQKHLRAGTGISQELTIMTRIFYMAKYQTKSDKGGTRQEFDYPVGRYWGVINRKKLAIQKEEFEVDRSLYFKLRRVMKKLLKKRPTKNRFREVAKGKQNGLWVSMSNEDILKLLNLYVMNDERFVEG